jgi:hypothetical protein
VFHSGLSFFPLCSAAEGDFCCPYLLFSVQAP